MKQMIVCMALCCSLIAMDTGLADDEKLLPSKALEQLSADYRQALGNESVTTVEQMASIQKELAVKILPRVKTTGIDESEMFLLTVLYDFAEQYDAAVAILERIVKAGGESAAIASATVVSACAKAGQLGRARAMLDEHWRRFGTAGENALSQAVEALAAAYGAQGEHQQAVDLVLDALERGPAIEIGLPGALLGAEDSFIALGRKDEWLALVRRYGKMIRKTADEMTGKTPDKGDEIAVRRQKMRIGSLKSVSNHMLSVAEQAEATGKPAPQLNFSRVLNSQPFTWDDLRGQVIVVEFWANTCGWCKRAFPRMNDLYLDYKDRGVTVVGATYLQGRFFDGDIAEPKVEAEEEYALTEGLIKRHKILWPVVFLDRPFRDIGLGIRGIPIFAVIDQKGVVCLIESREEKVRETIDKLLAE